MSVKISIDNSFQIYVKNVISETTKLLGHKSYRNTASRRDYAVSLIYCACLKEFFWLLTITGQCPLANK